MQKKSFSTELAYILGVVFLSLGTALMTRADFGVSMVVAPAYLLHLRLQEIWPFFSFGVAEYALQAALLIAAMLTVRRFKLSYLFSVVTVIFYGLLLDGFLFLLGILGRAGFAVRILYYGVGLLFCSSGVSMLFHTYFPPEVYELFVKEVAERYGLNLSKFKTAYDCASCVIAAAMSFAFFGELRGVQIGTVICALVNGWTIGQFSKAFEKRWTFEDRLKWRPWFQR